MPPKKIKPKKCAWSKCGKEFIPNPFQFNQKTCFNTVCALGYTREKEAEKEAKNWNKEKKAIREKLKSHKDWINDLQKVFNEYIRSRDEGKNCICCDKPLTKVFHAGHFWSCGAYPNLRFDEDNCHGQREDCNLHKHGNHAEYALRLPIRIGQKRFEELYLRRNEQSKLSVPEIKEKIIEYKQRIKELKNV